MDQTVNTQQAGGEGGSCTEEEVSLKTEIIKQKEEMIQCLQDELIKVRLVEAENEESIRGLNSKISELEEVFPYSNVIHIILRKPIRHLN